MNPETTPDWFQRLSALASTQPHEVVAEVQVRLAATPSEHERVRLALLRATGLRFLFRLDEAVATVEAVLPTARSLNDNNLLAEVLLRSAGLHMLMPQHTSASVSAVTACLRLPNLHPGIWELALRRLALLGTVMGLHVRARQTHRLALLVMAALPQQPASRLFLSLYNQCMSGALWLLDEWRDDPEQALQRALPVLRQDLDAAKLACSSALDEAKLQHLEAVWHWHAGSYSQADTTALPGLSPDDEAHWPRFNVAYRRYVSALQAKAEGDCERALKQLELPPGHLYGQDFPFMISLEQARAGLLAGAGRWKEACEAQQRAAANAAYRNNRALRDQVRSLMDTVHQDRQRTEGSRSLELLRPFEALRNRVRMGGTDESLTADLARLADAALQRVDAELLHAELDLLLPSQQEEVLLAESVAEAIDALWLQSAVRCLDASPDDSLVVRSHPNTLQRLLLNLLQLAAANACPGMPIRLRAQALGSDARVSIEVPCGAGPLRETMARRYAQRAASALGGALWVHLEPGTLLSLHLALPMPGQVSGDG